MGGRRDVPQHVAAASRNSDTGADERSSGQASTALVARSVTVQTVSTRGTCATKNQRVEPPSRRGCGRLAFQTFLLCRLSRARRVHVRLIVLRRAGLLPRSSKGSFLLTTMIYCSSSPN